MHTAAFTGVFLLFLMWASRCSAVETHIMEQGETFVSLGTSRFQIFCYLGRPKYLIHLWQSVFLQIDGIRDDFVQYEGASPDAVKNEYNANRYSWTFNLFSWKQKRVKLDPFNQSCIGIDSTSRYTVSINVLRIDYWKVLCLAFGILLFFSANKLSQNTLFYYLCGITVGVCTSFLILIYFISKLFPKKPVMYGVAVCGWTVGIYLFQLLWDNVRVIIENYRSYLVGYAVITGLLSFIICYRWGPIENERTINLLRWSLQVLGLIAIFFSTHFQEAAMGQIIVLVLFHNTPSSWLAQPKKYWKKRFPPKVKVLTNDEYYEQGVKETAKALGELRQYCSSPECNQWQMALKLSNVKRFASFIEGNSHLSDEEVLEYETSIQATDLTDDEDYTDEEQ